MESEFGRIERELYVDAPPEVVFEVISRPEHLREWWPDEATLDPVPGGVGELVWRGDEPESLTVVPMTVLQVDAPRLFSFRWGTTQRSCRIRRTRCSSSSS